MYGECHMHMFMNGKNYKEAVELHKYGVQDEDIHIISKDEMEVQKLQEEDLLVSDYRNPLSEILQEQYDSFMVNGHFVLFYNE